MRASGKRVATWATVALVCAGAVPVGAGAVATVTRSGNWIATFGVSVHPNVLPRTNPARASLHLASALNSADGVLPPSLRKLVLEGNATGTIDTRGLPTCPRSLQRLGPERTRPACADAIVGHGTALVVFHYPENTALPATLDMTLVNEGRIAPGAVGLRAVGYIAAPISSTFAIEIRVAKARSGGGGRWTLSAPKIADNNGSLISFDFIVQRSFSRQGHQSSVITARCPAAVLRTDGEAVLADGSYLGAKLTQSCTPKN